MRNTLMWLGLALGVAVGLGAGIHESGSRAAEAGERLSAKERARIELGRRLFFDPVVSRSGSRSCASCHDPDHGFSDPLMVSEDDVGVTRRHSQTLLDGRHNPTAHWDGEFESIEALVTARLGLVAGRKGSRVSSHGSPLGQTPGVAAGSPLSPVVQTPSLGDERERPSSTPGNSYGNPPPTTPTPPPTTRDPNTGDPTTPGGGQPVPRDDPAAPPTTPGGGDALAERGAKGAAESEARKQQVLLARDLARLPRVQDVLEESGRYADAFQAAFGTRSVTTARLAQAIASYCRSIEHTTAPFDRWRRGDEAAVSAAAKRGFALFQGKARCAQCHEAKGKEPLFTDFAFHNTGISWLSLPKTIVDDLKSHERDVHLDVGRSTFSRRARDRRAFKTPTLRDVTRRGPFMHDGQFRTLEQVVRYYAKGGSEDPRKDGRLRPVDLSDQEVQDLVAFLESLEGDVRPGLADNAWRIRPKEQVLRFVDARGKPLVGLAVGLMDAGDVLPGATANARRRTLTTDAKGFVRFAPPERTHTQLVLPDGLVPEGGFLVPDTTRRADIRIPVAGRVQIVVALSQDTKAPKQIVAEHLGSLVLPGHPLPRTLFEQTHSVESGSAQMVRYEAWRRVDVPAEVRIRVPGMKADDPRAACVLEARDTVRLDLR